MATRRPVAVINGRVSEIPVGDTIATDLVPAAETGSGALVDGGTPTTNHTGNLRVDFGSVT